MSTERTDSREVASVLQPDLQDGERIVWSGQPHVVYPIKYYLHWLIGIGLTCGGLWYLFGTITSIIGVLEGKDIFGWLGMMIAVPQMSLLLYVGIWKMIIPLSSVPALARNTYYAITDRRVLTVSTYNGRTVNAVQIGDPHALPRLTKPYADLTMGDLRMGSDLRLAGVHDIDHVFAILLELLPEDMREVPEARRRSYESQRRKDELRLRRWEKGLPSVATDIDDLMLPPPITSVGKGHAGFAKTPRPVLASTVLTLLFGSFTTQFAWILLLFFGLVFWSVQPWIYVPSPICWLHTTTVPGEIVGVRDTGERARDLPILIYTYQYTTRGADRTGTWYSTKEVYRPGAIADIVVPVSQIPLSMIKGLPSPWPDTGVLVWGLLHLLILRAMGLGIWRALRCARLLRIGKPGIGVVIDLSYISGGGHSSSRPETCSITVVHEVNGKRYKGTTTIFCNRKIKLEGTVFLLYDPSHPERVAIPDSATSQGVKTDRNGAIAVPEMSLEVGPRSPISGK